MTDWITKKSEDIKKKEPSKGGLSKWIQKKQPSKWIQKKQHSKWIQKKEPKNKHFPLEAEKSKDPLEAEKPRDKRRPLSDILSGMRRYYRGGKV